MNFATEYTAVGITAHEEGKDPGVVIVLSGLGRFTLNERGARKLADDILRNANELWPVKAEQEAA